MMTTVYTYPDTILLVVVHYVYTVVGRLHSRALQLLVGNPIYALSSFRSLFALLAFVTSRLALAIIHYVRVLHTFVYERTVSTGY